jgi:hypothetical protein
MFSPSTIRDMQDKAAREASRKGRKPYVFFDEAEVDRTPPFPMPFIGTYVPKGWTPLPSDHAAVEDAALWGGDGDAMFFCDTSGMGADGELALSVRQTKEELKRIVRQSAAAGVTVGFALIEVGQFQAVVGIFLKGGK